MLLGKSIPENWQEVRWGLIGFACLSASAAALWFIGLQVFWIEHLCSYCMVAHTGALILGGLFLWCRPVNAKTLRWVAGCAVGGIAGLILLQSLSAAPQTHEIIEFNSPNDTQAAPEEPMLFEAPGSNPQTILLLNSFEDKFVVASTCAALMTLTDPTMLLSLEPIAEADDPKPRAAVILNSIKLETNGWPLLGKPDAELVFVEMFDYTCEHCQRTHKAIEGARQKFGDRLAIIALPVPLDGKCNPNIKTSDPKHADACDLAKLAVALWYVDRDKFAEFHHYLFEKKPNYAAALIKAKEMVDNEKLSSAMSGSIPSEYIAKHIALYVKAGSGNIPKLMFPKTSSVGSIESTEVVVSLIEKNAK
jgi:protein-disulfide isomerase